MTKQFKVTIEPNKLHTAKKKGCQNTDHRTGKASFDSSCRTQQYKSGGIYKGGLD